MAINESQCVICGKPATAKFQIRQMKPDAQYNFSTIGTCDDHIDRLTPVSEPKTLAARVLAGRHSPEESEDESA